jgi:hypothetical protein
MLESSSAIPSDDSCGMKQSQEKPPEHAAIAYAALSSADHLQYRGVDIRMLCNGYLRGWATLARM